MVQNLQLEQAVGKRHAFTIRLIPDLVKRIKILAIRREKKLYAIIEEAILEKLAKEEG